MITVFDQGYGYWHVGCESLKEVQQVLGTLGWECANCTFYDKHTDKSRGYLREGDPRALYVVVPKYHQINEGVTPKFAELRRRLSAYYIWLEEGADDQV